MWKQQLRAGQTCVLFYKYLPVHVNAKVPTITLDTKNGVCCYAKGKQYSCMPITSVAPQLDCTPMAFLSHLYHTSMVLMLGYFLPVLYVHMCRSLNFRENHCKMSWFHLSGILYRSGIPFTNMQLFLIALCELRPDNNI